MANKKILSGILVLAFTITVIGCTDRSLNGTWVYDDDGYTVELKMKNGSFECLIEGEPDSKGTYTTKDNNMVSTTTHIYGSGYSSLLEAKWYTKAELKASDWKDEDIDEIFEVFTETYSISRDTLTLISKIDGDSYTNIYTKKQDNPSKIRIGRGGNINGSWTGNVQGYVITVVITDSDWTIAVPALRFSESGNYTRTDNTAALRSTRGVEYGTATFVNNNTISVALNKNTDFPGTYTLNRQ
jgi:hypothetical protein